MGTYVIGFKNPNWEHTTFMQFASMSSAKRAVKRWKKAGGIFLSANRGRIDSHVKRFTYRSGGMKFPKTSSRERKEENRKYRRSSGFMGGTHSQDWLENRGREGDFF